MCDESLSGAHNYDLRINKIRELIWGENILDEVFGRWSQGFDFSSSEPTALVQHEGGPCAVIAPVQAYLLKHLLFGNHATNDLKSLTSDQINEYLIESFHEIFAMVNSESLTLVSYNSQDAGDKSGASSDTEAKKLKKDLEFFHSSLKCSTYPRNSESWEKLRPEFLLFRKRHGIILFLYSVLLTKGLDEIVNEMQDPGEPLIDGIYGHGSQNLINLFLTGRAVSNVWDNDKDVSGLKLRGVSKQSTIGFLSYLEYLRYCEVGWYLKNPVYPIWLLASETHLSVLFSKERGIVSSETEEQEARRIFNSFDSENNGFIANSELGNLLASLDLVSETDYVNFLLKRLDSENLGIITLNSFLDEFFPEQTVVDTIKCFNVYHYNGLCNSAPSHKILYQEGQVILEDEPDVQVITDTSPIKLCLQTKWPTIIIKWSCSHTPSIY